MLRKKNNLKKINDSQNNPATAVWHPEKWMKHRCRLVRIWLIHKPIAVSITLSCFIHLSHKCPVGLFHHIFQHLPRFRSGKSFSVVESQHWHRSPAREQCPDVSMRCSLLSPVHPNMDCCCSGSQRPFPCFPPLSPSAPIRSYAGKGARRGFTVEAVLF